MNTPRFLDPDRQAVAEFCAAEGIGRIAEHIEPAPPPFRWKTEKPHGKPLFNVKHCGGRVLLGLREVSFVIIPAQEQLADVTGRAYLGICAKCFRRRLVFQMPLIQPR